MKIDKWNDSPLVCELKQAFNSLVSAYIIQPNEYILSLSVAIAEVASCLQKEELLNNPKSGGGLEHEKTD
jgi:hypothetical protein